MIKEFKLPELAEGVESAVVVGISVNTGDIVEKDQAVAELENSKATAEIPLPFGGTIKKIFKKVGDEILVGEVLMSVEVADANTAASDTRAGSAPPAPEQTVPSVEPPGDASAPQISPANPPMADVSEGQIVPAGPEVRRLARELGIALSQVHGTGPRGRIMPMDVKQQAKAMVAGPASSTVPATANAHVPAAFSVPPLPDFTKWGDVDEQPMTGIRRATADITAFSWQQIPHVTQHDLADITHFKSLRTEWQTQADKSGSKLTVTALLLKATAAALKLYPRFNCSVDMSTHKLIYKKYVHLAVAVEAEHGLLTPVIYNAERKSVFAIASELQTLSQKARDKKLSIEEMSGSTFAISNLGTLGTTSFGPLVTWPHVAALGVSKSDIRPVWQNDGFEPVTMLPLSISYDHRANDGADAARFLRWICEAMAQPLKIMMEAG